MNRILKSVMKAIYNLSDEDNYNLYDVEDIAEYLGLDVARVQEAIDTLLAADMLSECMSYDDDGIQTYVLKDRAIDLVENAS
ncbi:MAG: hypothetical protein KU37_05255 [Sulfuricurvum sp. PC08-66]|nr:MAG: hypothetical protein KU37_05255 [Sulfuricurvum sp. PC08-66]